jgi:uncharacterized protein (TIGR02452 family)
VFEGECYDLLSTPEHTYLCDCDGDFFGTFDSTIVLFYLEILGISFDVIDSLKPKLYEVYERRIRESHSLEDYRKFTKNWDRRRFRDQLAEIKEATKRDRERSVTREQRKQIAQETLKIQQHGFYTAPSGKRVDISAVQKRSDELSRIISPANGQQLVMSLQAPGGSVNTSYEVINASTVEAIIDEAKTGVPLAALNFASAKNPGGGFLNGAMAQEEALAASSGLYNTQLRNMEYYEANIAYRSMMYTDYAIYSPDVVFFRDENAKLLEVPVTCSILTIPAVNMRYVIEKGEDVHKANAVMKDRMRLALAILAQENNQTVILGAFGCGVFRNHPADVARWWHELLINEKYGDYFRRVLFVILDNPDGENIRAFSHTFGD